MSTSGLMTELAAALTTAGYTVSRAYIDAKEVSGLYGAGRRVYIQPDGLEFPRVSRGTLETHLSVKVAIIEHVERSGTTYPTATVDAHIDAIVSVGQAVFSATLTTGKIDSINVSQYFDPRVVEEQGLLISVLTATFTLS